MPRNFTGWPPPELVADDKNIDEVVHYHHVTRRISSGDSPRRPRHSENGPPPDAVPLSPALPCVCGSTLTRTMSGSVYTGTGVHCDVCDTNVDDNYVEVWHCTAGRNEVHPDGYDICKHCVIHNTTKLSKSHKILQSTTAHRMPDTTIPIFPRDTPAVSDGSPRCPCGEFLIVTSATAVYSGRGVVCDGCQSTLDKSTQSIYHCPKGKHDNHSKGYDMCMPCIVDRRRRMDQIKRSSTPDSPGRSSATGTTHTPRRYYVPTRGEESRHYCGRFIGETEYARGSHQWCSLRGDPCMCNGYCGPMRGCQCMDCYNLTWHPSSSESPMRSTGAGIDINYPPPKHRPPSPTGDEIPINHPPPSWRTAPSPTKRRMSTSQNSSSSNSSSTLQTASTTVNAHVTYPPPLTDRFGGTGTGDDRPGRDNDEYHLFLKHNLPPPPPESKSPPEHSRQPLTPRGYQTPPVRDLTNLLSHIGPEGVEFQPPPAAALGKVRSPTTSPQRRTAVVSHPSPEYNSGGTTDHTTKYSSNIIHSTSQHIHQQLPPHQPPPPPAPPLIDHTSSGTLYSMSTAPHTPGQTNYPSPLQPLPRRQSPHNQPTHHHQHIPQDQPTPHPQDQPTQPTPLYNQPPSHHRIPTSSSSTCDYRRYSSGSTSVTTGGGGGSGDRFNPYDGGAAPVHSHSHPILAMRRENTPRRDDTENQQPGSYLSRETVNGTTNDGKVFTNETTARYAHHSTTSTTPTTPHTPPPSTTTPTTPHTPPTPLLPSPDRDTTVTTMSSAPELVAREKTTITRTVTQQSTQNNSSSSSSEKWRSEQAPPTPPPGTMTYTPLPLKPRSNPPYHPEPQQPSTSATTVANIVNTNHTNITNQHVTNQHHYEQHISPSPPPSQQHVSRTPPRRRAHPPDTSSSEGESSSSPSRGYFQVTDGNVAFHSQKREDGDSDFVVSSESDTDRDAAGIPKRQQHDDTEGNIRINRQPHPFQQEGEEMQNWLNQSSTRIRKDWNRQCDITHKEIEMLTTRPDPVASFPHRVAAAIPPYANHSENSSTGGRRTSATQTHPPEQQHHYQHQQVPQRATTPPPTNEAPVVFLHQYKDLPDVPPPAAATAGGGGGVGSHPYIAQLPLLPIGQPEATTTTTTTSTPYHRRASGHSLSSTSSDECYPNPPPAPYQPHVHSAQHPPHQQGGGEAIPQHHSHPHNIQEWAAHVGGRNEHAPQAGMPAVGSSSRSVTTNQQQPITIRDGPICTVPVNNVQPLQEAKHSRSHSLSSDDNDGSSLSSERDDVDSSTHRRPHPVQYDSHTIPNSSRQEGVNPQTHDPRYVNLTLHEKTTNRPPHLSDTSNYRPSYHPTEASHPSHTGYPQWGIQGTPMPPQPSHDPSSTAADFNAKPSNNSVHEAGRDPEWLQSFRNKDTITTTSYSNGSPHSNRGNGSCSDSVDSLEVEVACGSPPLPSTPPLHPDSVKARNSPPSHSPRSHERENYDDEELVEYEEDGRSWL